METADNLEGVFEFFWVLTVPMRNGNSVRSCSSLYHCSAFLPYLWGMETSQMHTVLFLDVASSYRTYEEWKRWIYNSVCIGLKSSYRTYEEWKHIWNKYHLKEDYPFLPYLWGMETSGGQMAIMLDLVVLTVPMRNGNGSVFEKINKVVEFLPYLWGMETIVYVEIEILELVVLTVPMRNGNTQI